MQTLIIDFQQVNLCIKLEKLKKCTEQNVNGSKWCKCTMTNAGKWKGGKIAEGKGLESMEEQIKV